MFDRLDQTFVCAATLSPGIARIPHLAAFLPEIQSVERRRFWVSGAQCVLGWGHKSTALIARRQAQWANIPYIALEDGFIRSVGLGEAGAPAMGLVVDDLGIYYDATGPSRLEEMLETQPPLSAGQTAHAEALIDFIVRHGLSKTNLPALDPPPAERPIVLVIDQTEGDASIELGLAGDKSFKAMMEAAHDENPGAQIVLKRHPSVSEGLKNGCVRPAWFGDAQLIDQPVSTMGLIEQAQSVYTVTSLTGFEALMRNKPVRTFGMPFYAGWGASGDELSCARRTARRSVTEIFHAAYLRYQRMVDPVSGTAVPLDDALHRLAHLRERAIENQGEWALVGMAPWKKRPMRAFFAGPRSKVHFYSNFREAEQHAERGARICVWAGREKDELATAMAQSPHAIARIEDGFVRSRGLGSNFYAAGSMSLDDQGIYFDPIRPSRLETLLRETRFDPPLVARAAALRERLVKSGISKYNLDPDNQDLQDLPEGRRVALVVGQVADDASILRGCTDIKSDAELLEAVRATVPDDFIVYKPHPDVVAGNRKGGASTEVLARYADRVVIQGDIVSCLNVAHSVHTMTSLSGFEALLRGLPVYTYGGPFYAGWGLTHDRQTFPRRARQLSVDELVAAALILYPRYMDPVTSLPCTVEDLVGRIEAQTEQSPEPRPQPRTWRKRLIKGRTMRAIIASLHKPPEVRY